MKIIAFYLPQFHNIPENDKWWGEGFTEWVNVRKSTPVFDGHNQPRVPLNGNYYDLLDDSVKIWQAKIAKEHGIYGFAYYHYWFNGKLLLEKPMEQMLENKGIEMPFCISWANEPWTKAWVGNERVTLIAQTYGREKEWKEHFDYLLRFFKDDRYIKEDNSPLFIVYRPEIIPCLNEMLDFWQDCARKEGFVGIKFLSQSNDYNMSAGINNIRFSYLIEGQPDYAHGLIRRKKWKTLRAIRRNLTAFVGKHFGLDLYRYGAKAMQKATGINRVDYDEIWDRILHTDPESDKNVPGAFVGWDNSPRYGKYATIYTGDSPEKLEKYMSIQIKRAKSVYHSDTIFMYAWNEWAEGGYLEPDERYGYGNLDAIKKALIENDEFPW